MTAVIVKASTSKLAVPILSTTPTNPGPSAVTKLAITARVTSNNRTLKATVMASNSTPSIMRTNSSECASITMKQVKMQPMPRSNHFKRLRMEVVKRKTQPKESHMISLEPRITAKMETNSNKSMTHLLISKKESRQATWLTWEARSVKTVQSRGMAVGRQSRSSTMPLPQMAQLMYR